MSEQKTDLGATQLKALTSTAIDAMATGARLKDDRVQGLEVRKNATGTSFLLYYRTRFGQVRRPKIGAYPTLSIAQARDIARGWLGQVAAGQDPSAEAVIARSAPDMNDLWARCEAEHYTQDTKWGREAKSMYTRFLKPKLGKTKVAAVAYGDISGVHAKMVKTPNAANRTLAIASRMLNLAERWGWRPTGSNPCQLVERHAETRRRRFATADEISRVGAALDKLLEMPANTGGVVFLYCLMFSGARPSEIARATPDMLEEVGDAAVLRIEKGKTGERAVYLPAQAVRALARLPKDRENLCGRVTVPRALWKAVLKEANINGLWARDLRRTFATVAMTNGVSSSQVGELLGHKSAQTTKVYAKLMEEGAHLAAAGVAARIEAMLANPLPLDVTEATDGAL